MASYTLYVFFLASFISTIFGIVLGASLKSMWTQEDYKNIYYIQLPGRIMLNILQCAIIIHVASSLVTVVTTHAYPETESGKMIIATIYYMVSSVLVTTIGVALTVVNLSIQKDGELEYPGSFTSIRSVESVFDLIFQIFPPNLISAMYERILSNPQRNTCASNTITDINNCTDETVSKDIFVSGANVLGYFMFSLLLGFVISYLQDEGKPLAGFFKCINLIVVAMYDTFYWYIPFGSSFLIAHNLIIVKDMKLYFDNLTSYVISILETMFFYNCMMLPLAFFVITKNNPIDFAFEMRQPIFTTCMKYTSSSSLDVTTNSFLKNTNLGENIAKSIVPLGKSIFKIGTAVSVAISTVFIVVTLNYRLNVAGAIIISLVSVICSITDPIQPQSGLFTLIIMLTAIGIPVEHVSMILPVDWVFDYLRKFTNIWGNYISTGILNFFFEGSFEKYHNSVKKKGSGSDLSSA